MLKNWLTGFDLREYNPNIRRFFLFAIPLFSCIALFSLLYNLYLIRLGFREDFIGQLAGMFPLASGLVAIPTGIISDRIGRRPFLIGASLCLTVSSLGLCLVTSGWMLLAFSFLGGIAAGFVFVSFIPFLAENAAPERRGQAIAIWMSIQVITRMVVSISGGALPDLMGYVTGIDTAMPEPFRYALLIGTIGAFISIIPLFGIEVKPPNREPETPGESIPTPWKDLTAFGSISAFRGLSMGLAFPFFNVFFQEELNAATATIGVIFFASQVIGLPSTVSAPGMTRRFGPTLTVVPLRALGSLALAALGLYLNFPLAVALFLLSMAVEALTTPAEMAFATNTLSRPYWGRMQSLRVTGFQCLSAIGSIWAGSLIVQHGYWAAFGCAGLARFASALVFLIAFGYQTPSQAFTPSHPNAGNSTK